MQRTTVQLVKALLLDNYGALRDRTLPSLQPFIDTATVIIDRVATCAVSRGKTLTTTELELIERWLACHYYTKSDPLYTSRSTEGASGSFVQRSFLDGATDLDFSGCLKAIMSGRKARVSWGGKSVKEQVDYYTRNI